METTPTRTSKTSPRDFFLWAGAVLALYGSVISFLTLVFEYINHAFPDPLASYADPYGGPVRAAMAAVIVLVPTTLVLLRIIRSTINKEAGKADIWVRRWALVLTIFIATITILIDLITLLTTFLGGELSVRFILKVAIVLLVAGGVFLHFLAELKGYWLLEKKKAGYVGITVGILALATVASGFFIIGTPQDARMMRYDQQKVSDLQNIQYQITNYYQQKQALPTSVQDLADPLSGFLVPVDPQTQELYTYKTEGDLSFTLCAVFNRETPDTAGKEAYPARDSMYYGGVDENWTHGVGETCFTRTIDPDKYPAFDLKAR